MDRCVKCGYVFRGPQTDSVACLASIDRSLRTIKKVAVFWLILTLIGLVLWLLVLALR